jgi:hypothetical protein
VPEGLRFVDPAVPFAARRDGELGDCARFDRDGDRGIQRPTLEHARRGLGTALTALSTRRGLHPRASLQSTELAKPSTPPSARDPAASSSGR